MSIITTSGKTRKEIIEARAKLEKLAESKAIAANEIPVFYIAEPRAYELLFRHEHIESLFDVRHLSDIPNQAAEPFGIDIAYNNGMLTFEQYKQDHIESDILLGIMSAKDICANVKAAMEILKNGQRIFALAPYSFLESEKRVKFFREYPIQKMLISPSRYRVAKNGKFEFTFDGVAYSKSNINYAWYVWEKGWEGKTVIEWFNYDSQEIYDLKHKDIESANIDYKLTRSAKKLLRDYL